MRLVPGLVVTPEARGLVIRGVGAGVNATMLSETLQVVGIAEAAQREVRLRKKPMNLCVCDSEQRECGVGDGVNATMLSETLKVVGIAEVTGRAVLFRKKTMNLCAYDSE